MRPALPPAFIGRPAAPLSRARGVSLGLLLALATTFVLALEPSRPIVQFSQKVWRTDEGLPENFVRTMLQTSDGYLWLGTQEGLVRFDGMQLKVFDTRNTPLLRSNAIIALAQDSSGTLWIGTDGGGITRYREGQFLDCLHEGNVLENNYIRDIHAEPDGSVWITAHGGGLIRLQGGKRDIWTTRDGLASDSLRTILIDSRGRLWIGADESGLSMRHHGVYRHFGTKDGLASDQIRVLYEDRQGGIWVGTRGAGLFRYENGKFKAFTIRDGLPANSIRALLEDRDGSLWVGLESGGLARFRAGKFDVLDTSQGLPHNFVRALLEDSEGNLWVGTRGGLMRLRNRTVETWTTSEGLINDNVKTVLADRSGTIWVGTATGLNEIHAGRIRTVNLSGHWADDFVRAIAQTDDGAMWFGTDNGLYRRAGGRLRVYRRADGLPDDRVRSIAEDRSGRVWVGTVGGLGVLIGQHPQPLATVLGPSAETLSSAYITALAVDASQALWIGTGDGLYRYANNAVRRFSSGDGLPHNVISALHVDATGALWVGTRGGLGLLRAERFAAFTRRDGLLSDNLLHVLDDGLGALWITTPRAISRVETQQLARFLRGEISSIQPVSFDTADGMKSAEFSNEGQPRGSRAPDGRLWLPTVHGVVVLNPAELQRSGTPPRVLVEQVRAGDEAYAAGQSNIRIPAGTGDLELQFTAISFGAPERIRFCYMLEGFDAGWVDAGRRRVAYYTNLPPRDYRFRIAANPYNGSWPAEEVSQSLTLLPHFYQRSWFVGLCFLALLGLAVLGYRLRMRAIRRRFHVVLAERTRIAREIHDTLMQGVTGISLQLEVSSRQLLASPLEAKQRIDLALEKLDATLAEARECVLELRRPDPPRRSLVRSLKTLVEQATEGLPLAVQFEVKGTERDLPALQHDQLVRIAREAVTNAAAHAGAAELNILLEFEPHRIHFEARDNGRGFEPERVNGGHFGIVGMRERARSIGADLAVRSAPGAGTEVAVSIPNKPVAEILLP